MSLLQEKFNNDRAQIYTENTRKNVPPCPYFSYPLDNKTFTGGRTLPKNVPLRCPKVPLFLRNKVFC